MSNFAYLVCLVGREAYCGGLWRVNKRKLVFALCVSVSLSVDANTWQSPAVVQLHRRFFFCPRRHVSISTFLKFFTSPPTYYRILQMHHFSIYLDSELSYRLYQYINLRPFPPTQIGEICTHGGKFTLCEPQLCGPSFLTLFRLSMMVPPPVRCDLPIVSHSAPLPWFTGRCQGIPLSVATEAPLELGAFAQQWNTRSHRTVGSSIFI
ncbi:hypothetical protein BJV77DRAFT_1026819 [Russula vinacea]|nr:hypothetical protein BJV77DRAFT_1026819 [Russula vinacea]